MSQLSLGSSPSDIEDWDRSMSSDADPPHASTPRNSVSFPGHDAGDNEGIPGRNMSLGRGAGKRTLSDLLKLHAEKGQDVNLTQEEASRLADVLGQWVSARLPPVLSCGRNEPSPSLRCKPPCCARLLTPHQQINSASSPYEAEDDFFSRQSSQDDSSIPSRSPSGAFETSARPRGQSESVVSKGQS